MLKQNERFYGRKLAPSLVSLIAALTGTAFGGALAADNITDKASMGQMFLLPTDREQTPENIALVTKYLERGRKASDNGEFDKAIGAFQEAYGLAREIKHGEGEGEALTEMCLYYQAKGQLARAKELGENAIEVLADTTNKKALGEARAALARVYLMQDNTYTAMQQLQLAMDCFDDMGATDGESASKILMLAADVGIKTGHIKEALQFYEAAAGFSGQAGKTKAQITVQMKVAKDLITLGYYTAALEEASKALSTARETKKPDELVAALSTVANAQYCLCEYPAARESYEEALQIKFAQQTIESRSRLVQGYAFCLAATGDLDQARTQLEKCLPYIKKSGQIESRAETENALGVINSLQGNHQVALQNLKSALETASLVSPKANRLQCIITQNLAAAQSRLGQNRFAKVQYANALQFARDKKFNDRMLEGRTYAALAETCLNLKEYPDAEDAARKGITVSQSINDDAALWRLYTSLAQVQLATGQNATESLESAVSFFRSPQAGDFANPAELTYPTRRDEKGHELVGLLLSVNMTEQSLLAAEQLKQEAFINEWHRRGGQVRLADRDLYDDMVIRRAHFHAAEAAGNSPSVLMKDWRDWVIRFQHIAAENPGLARLIAPVPISMAEVIKTVQASHACIVDYLVGTKSTIAFVIDGNRKLTGLVLPVGKDDLQSQVATLLTSSTKTDESARAAEHRILQLLYSELLPAEVARALPSNADQPVVIIPDAILYNLPFAALISNDGKYLIETHTMAMAPELDVLMNVPRRTKDLSLLVADRSGDDNESGQIASIFDPAQVTKLSGKDAEINALQEQAKSNSIIHFAAEMKIPQNNPLSSLFPLASQEAGTPVTANSLFELTLPNDLAVLSGTSVNAKDYRGNGVQVFCRGLNYAGVRNVLMSLWVAPDAARTSELLEFYRSRQQGLSQAQSLRKAQLLALSKDPSPRAWAAFQLLGPSF
ncbi:MAG TPA: CHAT domain-containing protein [Candidatus Obscuribacterales bacterium]